MKNIITLAILLLMIACTHTDQESIKLPLLDEGELTTADNAESEECIFDQETQTDEFLRGIEELQGYTWDQDSRTATILLEQGDTLFITRGGCYHFTVSAAFKLYHDKTDYSNWSNVYQRALWVAKILDREYSYEELKADIDSAKVTIERYHHADIASFESETLVDNEYVIERRLLPDRTVIVLQKTIL